MSIVEQVIPEDIMLESGNEFRTNVDFFEDDQSVFSQVTAIQAFNHAATFFVYTRNWRIPIIICLIGVVASSAFLAVGITGANRDQEEYFESLAEALIQEFDHSWRDYETAGMWIHEACRDHDVSRTKFRELYEHLKAGGLEFQAASWAPNVTHDKRQEYEDEVDLWYSEEFPELTYEGFQGFEPNDPNNPEAGSSVQSRSEQAFYFPVHFIEPVEGNQAAIHFDLYSSASRRATIHQALSSWKPALTSRLHLVQEIDASAYSVLLMHPGIPLSTQPHVQASDISSMVIRVPDLLARSTASQSKPLTMYVYDTTLPTQADFLGGVTLTNFKNGKHDVLFLPEIELNALHKSNDRIHEEILGISSSTWAIVVVAVDGSYKPVTVYIILGGVMILLGCVCLAVCVYYMLERQVKLAQIRTQAEADKAAYGVENARRAARNERELNDFIAHEVRNPLAAAMSACSFVMSAVNDETKPFLEAREVINEDLSIIDSSLQFINDLLRNMLDMHRAKSKQLTIDWAPVDIMEDVFKPVDAMLYRRGGDVKIDLVCPPNLVIVSDRLRLKQIVLNLGRNALKFVEKGFIRLTAVVVFDGTISLFIEDSGPGIPPEKRKKMFAKFQESLDSLHQGTGIGLSLCLNLVELMGGKICLDEMYDSGLPGRPGARIVIHLKKLPLDFDDLHLDALQAGDKSNVLQDASAVSSNGKEEQELPKHLSVLFVDDDMVLRKLFARSIRKLCPDWSVQEASNGESALQLVKEDTDLFQLIFVDQYMASVEKQLLGTETVRALRVAGCHARICGSSANDVENAFEDAGANAFMFKPFPTKAAAMKNELLAILDGYMDDRSSSCDRNVLDDVSSGQGMLPPHLGILGEDGHNSSFQNREVCPETVKSLVQMSLPASKANGKGGSKSRRKKQASSSSGMVSDLGPVKLAIQVLGSSNEDLTDSLEHAIPKGEELASKIF
jgi:signal transduction histidine kinase/CHASE1-domain containing sensor protein/CheY-like chemotaxis protein